MRHLQVGLVVAICLASSQVHGQPVFAQTNSIEYTVTDADVVVIGKVLEFGRSDPPDRREVTILVQETLKGERRPRVSIRLSVPLAVIAGWKTRNSRLLVAAQEPGGATAIDLSDGKLEVLKADFTLLRRPEDVIRAAGEAVRRMPGVTRIRGFNLMAPNEVMPGTQWQLYYGLIVTVPVDDRLEQRAREFCRSPELGRRREAALALRNFRSDENIALVTTMLDDPGLAEMHRPEENEGLGVRVYVVREEAYRTLQEWGVAVKEPVFRVESLRLDLVTLADLSNRQVTGSDFDKLSRFENLSYLNLCNDELKERNLEQIGGLKRLETLNLGGTNITDAWLGHLTGLAALHYLDLRTTKVSDEALKILAGLKGLKTVDLGQSRVTDAGVAELRGLRPDLEIKR